MNRRLALTLATLTFHASFVGAAIQSSDFWFHDDGDIVFIDGHRGGGCPIFCVNGVLINPGRVDPQAQC